MIFDLVIILTIYYLWKIALVYLLWKKMLFVSFADFKLIYLSLVLVSLNVARKLLVFCEKQPQNGHANHT
jgi:hypothetical protein